ncbi:putative nucleoredoxin 1-2 [Apium graveolens]|uniref:putative nucleoredoxin 1-2 n=1 Tax=Apium graveolens TaxID=4045 RepID=UPI003D7BE3C0
MEQIRDWNGKPKYQPPPEPSETEIPERSVQDILFNQSHPWEYDKLGNTNIFHLFGAANTECLFTWEGHKVPTSDLKNKTVGLYMLNPYPSHIILEELKRICEDKKEDFVLIPVITSYHSSWSWIRAECSHLERSIPWYTLPASECRYLHKVFQDNLKEPYLSSGACDLVILKGDKHLSVSFFALHIFARFGVDAYPFTMENAVKEAKNEQGDIVLNEILSSKSSLRRQGNEEVIPVSDLDNTLVLLLFVTPGCAWESVLSTIKNAYVNKRDVDFEIIYINLDISSESTSFSNTIQKIPWVVHSSKPEVALSLFECLFPISPQLPAIAAFGVDGHLETKGSDLASNDKLVSQYPPFIQADMYDEVYQELKDEHGWDLENLFYSRAESETSSLKFRQIYG